MTIRERLENQDERKKIESEIRQMFDKADKNGTGLLSFGELYRVCLEINTKINKEPPTEGDVKKLMTEADTNKDGLLNLTEFTALMFGNLEKIAEAERQLEASKKEEKARN